MDIQCVLRAYSEMANLTLEEAMKDLPLVKVAAAMIQSQQKVEAKQEDAVVLQYLCAALVCLWHFKSEAAASPSQSFTANGYTIKKDTAADLKAAQALYDQWRASAAYLLTDNSFIFTHTEGKPHETSE